MKCRRLINILDFLPKEILKKVAFPALLIFSSYQNISIAEIKSGTCKPYYASLKASRVNAHKGPGKNYKISWEYTVKGVPIIVIATYDHWRLVQDPYGDKTWIHKSLLSQKRSVITTNDRISQLRADSNDSAKIIAEIKKNVVMSLMLVRGKWCKVEINHKGNKYVGWIDKSSVFGVSENESS